MQSGDYTVFVGASGWEYAAWEESFYPEDLPSDWRLSFYSNEFPVVLLPASRLAEAATPEVTEWLEETHAKFRFVLQLDRPLDAELQARLEILRPKLLAVVVPRDQAVALPESLAGLPQVMEKATDKSCELHLQAGLGHCWDGHGAPCWGDDIALVCLSAGDYKDMRQLKEVIASCQPALEEGRQLVLLFEGEAPDIEVMRNARTIVELLGY
jgi:hypothetical protein